MKKSNNTKHNVVISGYYGFDNFGDETILDVLIKKLKELGADITVLSKTPKKTASLYQVKSSWFICLRQATWAINKCDVLISGGGSLLQDVTSLKSLVYYLWIINTALFLKKKVIIFAQGIGPINSKIGQFLTKKNLKKCSLITVRDEKSLELLKKWEINATLVCDPLFDLSLQKSTAPNRVGVQLRGFKTLKENMLKKLAQQINKEFKDKEIEIYSFQDALDLSVCKHFEQILKSVNPEIKTKVIYDQTSSEILDKISKLEYLIAMRFHANLIALKAGVKTLAISYDEKVEKLAKESQIPYISMDATENYDELFNQMKNLDENKLIEFANSKHFDWSKIEEIINFQ